MNKMLALLLITCISLTASAQGNKYAVTDSIVKKLGSLDSFNVAIIADTLTRRFPDKEMKARAIFYWIANNISYDLKAMKANDNRFIDPVAVIKMRKATPEGYAKLFQEMSSMANIRCLTVDGYVKSTAEEINNPADEINHTWNVIQLGQSPEQWYYVDVTKASGYADKKMSMFTRDFTSEYFFADRILFNLDHFPDNSAWQLGPGPKTIKDFYALPVFSSAAYKYGLQKPQPFAGSIKGKTKTVFTFALPHNIALPIASLSIVTGEEKKQEKQLPMNFTDNGSLITFTHQFKKDDTYPVRVVADGKILLQYYAEIKE